MRPSTQRRLLGALVLILAGLGIYLQAQGASLTLRAAMVSVPVWSKVPEFESKETPAVSARGLFEARQFAPLVDAFDHQEGAQPTSTCPELNLRVISDWGDDAHSLVSFSDAGKTLTRRVGGRVAGRTLAAIGTHPTSFLPTVWFSGPDSCYVSMHAAAPEPGPDLNPPGKSTPATDVVARAVRGIKRIDEGQFVVDRALFEEMLTDPSGLSGTARAVMTGGREGESGLRLLSVRRDSPLTLLGFRRGDVLTAINGHSLAKPQELLRAYATLAQSERFEIELQRGAESRKIVAEVR